MSAAALDVALTAYETGEVVGRLLPFLLGAGLLIAGLVRRSRSAPAASPYEGWAPAGAPTPVASTEQAGSVESASPNPIGAPAVPGGPGDGAPPAADYGPAPAPPQSRGTGLIVAGSVLLGVGVIGFIASGADRASELAETRVERTVALPEQLIGLTRDPALSDKARADADAAGDLPPGAQVGAYGNQENLLLVIAAATRVTDVEAEITSYRRGVEGQTGRLGDGTPVDPGELGGAARCWSVEFEGIPGSTCVFVDGGSILSTIDFGATDPQQAGERGRQARAGTVRAQ